MPSQANSQTGNKYGQELPHEEHNFRLSSFRGFVHAVYRAYLAALPVGAKLFLNKCSIGCVRADTGYVSLETSWLNSETSPREHFLTIYSKKPVKLSVEYQECIHFEWSRSGEGSKRNSVL
jgi:hypothetical protein